MLTAAAWPPSARRVDTVALRASAGRLGTTPSDRLAFAARLGQRTPPTAAGSVGAVLATLGALGAADVALARTVEPHLDALGILAQAGVDAPTDGTWGVFAAEGPGLRLDAVAVPGSAGSPGTPGSRESPGTPGSPGSVVLRGTKPWCSLASVLDHALVTAHDGEDRVLVAVDLRHPGVTVHDEAWVARGMPDVPSGPVDFADVPATLVGDPGWYLRRPGFAWGGIGVAACWWGGAVGLAEVLRAHAAARADSELLAAAVGAVTLDLADAEAALADAAARIDGGVHGDGVPDRVHGDGVPDRVHGDGVPGDVAGVPDVDDAFLAQVVRSRVRRACDDVLERVVDAIGPGPLTADPAVAARVADLGLYLLQDHGRRDVARVGRMVLDSGRATW